MAKKQEAAGRKLLISQIRALRDTMKNRKPYASVAYDLGINSLLDSLDYNVPDIIATMQGEVEGTISFELERKEFLADRTLGELTVIVNGNKDLTLKTLELPWRNNDSNVSCIPTGTYRIRYRYACEAGTAFLKKYDHIMLESVPGRYGVMIHRGNNPTHTQGCILVGLSYYNDAKHGKCVGSSELALNKLISYIYPDTSKNTFYKLTISGTGERPTPTKKETQGTQASTLPADMNAKKDTVKVQAETVNRIAKNLPEECKGADAYKAIAEEAAAQSNGYFGSFGPSI